LPIEIVVIYCLTKEVREKIKKAKVLSEGLNEGKRYSKEKTKKTAI
jgi:hypothetical protein